MTEVIKEMNPKVNTFSQDTSTLKGDNSSIFKLYKDHHSSVADRKTEANNQTANIIIAFTVIRILTFILLSSIQSESLFLYLTLLLKGDKFFFKNRTQAEITLTR